MRLTGVVWGAGARFAIAALLLLMMAGAASAVLDCTDEGSDGIADNIIIVGNSSSCTTDGSDDNIELQYAANNLTDNMSIYLNSTFYNTTNNITVSNIKNVSIYGLSNGSTTFKHSHDYWGFYINNVTKVTLYDLGFNTSLSDRFTAASRPRQVVFNASSDILVYNIIDRNKNCAARSVGVDGASVSNRAVNITIRDSVLRSYIAFVWVNNATLNNVTIDASLNTPACIGTITGGVDFNANADNITINNSYINTHGNTYGIRHHSGNYITIKNSNISRYWFDFGSNNRIINNTILGFLGGADQGLRRNNTFSNNILKSITTTTVTGAIHLGNDATESITEDFNIMNNMIYDCPENCIYINEYNGNYTIKNNIMYGWANGYYGINNVSAFSINASYNLFYNTTAENNYTGVTCINCLNQTDPLFVSTSDFHLQSTANRWNGTAWVQDAQTSPAIGAGDPTSDNSLSLWGGIIEMGAYGNTAEASQGATTYIPPTPISLANTTGNFWANHTWAAGAGNITDSFNVSHNGTWTNGSAITFSNNSVGAGNWSNITVWAWNSSGTGTLSTGSVSQNTQAPASFTPSNVTISCPVGWCYLAMNYSNRTLLQLDNIYSTDTVQGWYNSTSQKYESHRTGYSPNQNSNVTQKHGYYYYFRTTTNVPVNLTDNPSITLNAGWNLVGNMNNTNRTLSTLKTSIGAEATQARHFNNSLQSWQSADAETVNTGESFMVYLTSSKAWSD